MRLKSLRKLVGLNQTELSKRLGILRTTYNKYELGQAEPSISSLIKIADFFDVSLDYLCERQWKNKIGYVSDERREDMMKISQLSDKQFQLVVAYVKALTELDK